MFCGKCGNQVEPDALFCNVCGEKIVKYENIEELNNNSINEFSANKNSNVNPNNSQYSNNKATKTGLIIFISVAAIVVIIGIILGVVFVSKKIKNDKINKDIDINNNTTKELNKIGNSEFGYLKVEDNWYKYNDVDNPSVLEYTLDGNWIISMYARPSSTIDAKTYADSCYTRMKQDGAVGVTGATVKVGIYTAYQVYGYYTSLNKWLVTWCFELGDKKTHYIGIEGPDRYSDNFKIPDTFTLY
ncbi:uncharacterized protein BN667_00622 [Clostridium sp. CAG:465]|nr:uncharacterized protein BN667_00622 [Clostridium sp. CAG:465]